MPSEQQFRPRRPTPKPFVQGPQTAVVVGPGGDEIYTDKYGRVKVQFHWDRLRQEGREQLVLDPRVAALGRQGLGRGPHAAHRPGSDRRFPRRAIPISRSSPAASTTPSNMPPYKLPANKTQSGVKSRSTLGGTPDNFNEIRFEDKKGKEHVVIHAERNLNILAKANERRTIGVTAHHCRQ